MSRVQKRFLTAIFFIEIGAPYSESAETCANKLYIGFWKRNEPDWLFWHTLASYQYALTLYVVKEYPLLWPAGSYPRTQNYLRKPTYWATA